MKGIRLRHGDGLWRAVRSSPAGGHHEPHPPHWPLAGQPEQTRQFPARPPRGRAGRGRDHAARTASLDHVLATACHGPPHRRIRAARRCPTAGPPGKAARNSRVRLAAAYRPTVHPLPGEPGRILGQPNGQQDHPPAVVPVLLPGTGPEPLRHRPLRRLTTSPCSAGTGLHRRRPGRTWPASLLTRADDRQLRTAVPLRDHHVLACAALLPDLVTAASPRRQVICSGTR
jgi:hypothetical protein